MYALFCTLCFHRANWHSSTTLTEGFPCLFLSCKRNAGYNSQRQGTARTLPKLIVLFCVLFVCKCVLYCCHRVFVCKCVLYYCHRVFVYKCVLYCCHRVSTQLQLTNIYHIIPYHIVQYHTILYHISYHTILYHTIYYIIPYISHSIFVPWLPIL
jgi:hypothetical protein